MRVKLAEIASVLIPAGYLLARVLNVAQAPQTGGGVTDHGALTGLGDDDHPQYTTDAEATAIVTAAILAAIAAADGAGLSDNGAGVLAVNVDGTTLGDQR